MRGVKSSDPRFFLLLFFFMLVGLSLIPGFSTWLSKKKEEGVFQSNFPDSGVDRM